MSAVSCARTEGRAFRIFRLLSSLLSKNAKVPCLPSILEKESVLYLSQNVVGTFIDRIEVFNDERVKIRFTFEDTLKSYETG